MNNFTILMDLTKYLKITTPNVYLYQGENCVDRFQILIPVMYGDVDLSKFTAAMEYIDEDKNAYLEILSKDEEIYKDKYVKFTLPINTQITKRAGDITAQLSLNYVDPETQTQYVLHTSEVIITIHPVSDYYKFSDDSLNKIDNLVGRLAEKIDYLTELEAKSIVNDLGFDSEGVLHVAASGKLIGNGVNVAVPGEIDNDGNEDGILDLDKIYNKVTL